MTSERMLRKWRKEALKFNSNLVSGEVSARSLYLYNKLKEANLEIIKMTQDLLDQHLLK